MGPRVERPQRSTLDGERTQWVVRRKQCQVRPPTTTHNSAIHMCFGYTLNGSYPMKPSILNQ